MIKITEIPLEHTRTPNKSCRWLARCTVGGVDYEASSRRGASTELARVIIAAGVPDQPVEVNDLRPTRPIGATYPSTRWRSLHVMAKWTYEESDNRPLRRVPWRPAPDLKRYLVVDVLAKIGVKRVWPLPHYYPPPNSIVFRLSVRAPRCAWRMGGRTFLLSL
jgi:hypothetical protein